MNIGAFLVLDALYARRDRLEAKWQVAEENDDQQTMTWVAFAQLTCDEEIEKWEAKLETVN